MNMPTSRRCTATVVDGFALVIGGYRANRALRTVEVFNPQDRGWRRLPDLSEAVNPSASVWVGNRVLLFGQEGSRQRQLAYDLRAKQLAAYPLALPDSDLASAILHRGHVYVVGGANLRQHLAASGIQVFQPLPDAPTAPPARR